MTDGTVTASGLVDALARLDQDIAETERRLAELQAMRRSIQPFIEQYVGATPPGADAAVQPPAKRASFTDEVVAVFREHPDDVLEVDDVREHMQDKGIEATREAVRNAIHYAARQGKVHKERRGRFTLKDTSTPAATGVDVGEEPNSEGSSREIGGNRDSGSTPPHDQGGGANFLAPDHLGRAGDRASIGG